MDCAPSQQQGDFSREIGPHFWYSPTTAAAMLSLLFLAAVVISSWTPPLQSPDEPAHLARAYLLSKGEIFLHARDGETGGEIDSAFLAYIDLFSQRLSHYDEKVTEPTQHLSRKMVWSGHRKFRGLPNTALYFPLPYIPQAAAIALGEGLRVGVGTTYTMSRLFSLSATLILLWTALRLYPTPPIMLALFSTPMTLFQLGAASLDAVTFGTCALTAALFARGSDTRFSFSKGMHWAIILCAFSLATSRIVLIPITLLPSLLYFSRRSKAYLVSSAIAASLSLAWIVFAFLSVKGLPAREVGTTDAGFQYLLHPTALIHVFYNTLSSREVLGSYWAMFIGVLGWLDIPLDPYVYTLFAILFAVLAIMSLQRDIASCLCIGQISLVSAGIVSLVLTFVVELVTWTPYPSALIEGIQGRYFTPIMIFLSYSIFGRRLSSNELKWGLAINVLAVALSVASTIPKLTHRYWMS